MDRSTVELNGLTLKPFKFENKVSKYDITLEASES